MSENGSASAPARGVAALYDAEGQRAYSLAFAIVGDEAAAADVVVGAFGTLRSAGSGRRAESRALLLQCVYAAATALRARDRGLRVDARGALLGALTPEQRQTLVLCLHGVSCAELAGIERTSTEVVAARLGQALRQVRGPLSGGAGEPAADGLCEPV